MKQKEVQLYIKYIFDFCVCIIGMIICSPLFLVICLAIKASSKGTIFFKQDRIGKDGKIFQIIKFRTMVENAEHIGDGLIVQTENDPRITKVGKILRSTSLDELPQLVNIIRGEMSIVGPRPPVTYHPYDGFNNYPATAKKRFQMRPGITGLAQIRKRNSATWDERIEIDIEYVNNFNLLLDLSIIFRTFSAMLYKEEYTA